MAQVCLQVPRSVSVIASGADASAPALQGHESVIVVVMEFCDLGSVLRAVTKKAFRPHGKWTYHTTYVSAACCLAVSWTGSSAGPPRLRACVHAAGCLVTTCRDVHVQPGALFCRGHRCRPKEPPKPADVPFHVLQRALLRTAQEIAKGMDYIHSFGIIHGVSDASCARIHPHC